ncbi:transposase [Sinorhizobium garamanticum]|uniref:Transposase n=1 Tax=Sinorhizobium garamanticum TaxID=680247 RepID=A0ABY8DJ40_9HYPH|nr:transposase [Sinorhizobium garamanticum]WEX90930.1 transposase [Sinorhizobium garamanticum]
MKQYAGIDVSLEYASVCVMDADGGIVREAKILSEPDALIAWFGEHGVAMERIGLEAGPLSQWLHAGMVKAGLCVELIETRHVRAAFETMPVKTDKKDARGIAQLMRLGWFRPVHCKSLAAQEVRALLTARKLIQGKLHDIEMSLRGILRGFGLNVGPTTRRSYVGAHPRADCRPFDPGSDRDGTAEGARRACACICRFCAQAACHRPPGRQRTAVDDDARRWRWSIAAGMRWRNHTV